MGTINTTSSDQPQSNQTYQPPTTTTSISMSDYKPTEHDGLRKDGQPDQRVGTGQFAQGKVDPTEAGKQGGQTSGDGSGGSAKGEFAHGKVDPHEAGKQGGSK